MMNFLIIFFIAMMFFIPVNLKADESLQAMMEGMLKQHQGLVDNFFKQGFNPQLSKFKQDIKVQSKIKKQNSKTYEKIEITAQDGEASFNIRVTDHVMVNANVTKNDKGNQSISSLTKMFPIPHKGIYKPEMTRNSKNKVELYFEVPANHKIYQSTLSNMNAKSLDSFMDIDIRKDIDRLKNQLLRSFGDDDYPNQQPKQPREIIKPKRKALFPQKKT